MKTKLIFLAFLVLNFLNLKAQCNPTVTSPRLEAMFQGSVVFCNSENETLSVTQTFQSYQWYKQEWDWQTPNPNPWVAIPGATSQTLTINGTTDMLHYFKVEVSDGNDCVAESTPILADGYAYGVPYLMANFTPGTYEEVNGIYNVCAGASVELINGFSGVYGNHTWFKCLPSNNPPLPNDPCAINGPTGSSYVATGSGEYGFYACTQYCPDQCELLNPIAFMTLNFGEFSFCNLSTGETKTKENDLSIYPNPATQLLFIGKESDKKYSEISIIDMSGKLILQKKDHQAGKAIDVSALVPGAYLIVSKSIEGKVYKNKLIKK